MQLNLGNFSELMRRRGGISFSDVKATDFVAPGGALGTPSSGTLTNCAGLPVAGIAASTATALGVGSVELGHASDTTLSRSAAGVLAVEGVAVPTVSSTDDLSNKNVLTALNAQTASYTLVLADKGKAVEVTSASATNVTVPPNSSVDYPIGTVIEVAQLGTGQVTLVAGEGVTLQTPSSLLARAQFSSLSLRKRATDTWLVTGDMQ